MKALTIAAALLGALAFASTASAGGGCSGAKQQQASTPVAPSTGS